MPWQFSVYRRLKLGVSLTEQGFDVIPAALLDWLDQIDALVHETEAADGS